MRKRMQMMLRKQQQMEDQASKKGGGRPNQRTKHEFAPTSALD